MRMKAFSPYTLHHLSFASVLEGEAGQAKLARSGTPIARLQGVGAGHFIQVYFSTPAAENQFKEFVSSMDEVFFEANIPAIGRGYTMPADVNDRIRFVLEAMVEHTVFDMELFGKCRHNTLYRLKDDPPNEYRALKVSFSPKVKAAIHRDYGESVDLILNETIG